MSTMPRPAVNAEQVYAVLVTLQNDTLLLPNLGIAEVISREGLQPPSAAAPDWYAGKLTWQGQSIPVASFERLNGADVEGSGRRSRVVVINAIGNQLSGGRYGLLCEGYPHLVTIQRESIRSAEARPSDNPELALARVLVASRTLVIPNLEYIETQLATVLATLS